MENYISLMLKINLFFVTFMGTFELFIE